MDIYRVVWSDSRFAVWSDGKVITEGVDLELGHSLHKTRKGAEAEARRMHQLVRKHARENGQKVTIRYRVNKHLLLP
jgi:hypothetical protein